MEMEMEMEMRGMEEIEIGTDITTALTPLTFSLHSSKLTTHCSTCFSLLPPSPSPITLSSHSYCSAPCSAANLHHLHHSFADDYSSDLRAALRLLLCHRPDHRSGRIAGLLSNRHKLTWRNRFDDDDEVSERINVGSRALAAAVVDQRGEGEIDAVLEDAAIALCAVLTNAVEVQDEEGCALGIAVFGPTFSWINHSCSPNACYRFILSSPSSPSSEELKLRIAPFARGSRESEIDNGVCSSSSEFSKEEEEQGYGPRLIVRSIKMIKKGEEVTVAYTDLLQPKAMRQLDLWSKYRFVCCCRRCSAQPFTYVDRALQEISVSNVGSTCSYSNYKVLRGMADRRLADSIDDVISVYLTVGDPESSCGKLEEILIQGLSEQLDDIEEKMHYKFMLQPLHHLSLSSYTTLASAYKVCAGDFLLASPETDLNQLKAFDKSRTSAAYSLLLAGATHHLFQSESSLVSSIVNFWTGAGESLLSLARSSEWDKFIKLGLGLVSNISLLKKLKCSKCSLMDRYITCMSTGQIRSDDFENVSDEFLHCVSHVTQKVWSFLVNGCHFLRSIKDPINFSWLMSTKNSSTVDLEARESNTGFCYSNESESSIHIFVEQAYSNNVREHILQLGVHCLAYGGLLAIICYGHHSHLACYVQHILDHEENIER